jgi:hypothetical protein
MNNKTIQNTIVIGVFTISIMYGFLAIITVLKEQNLSEYTDFLWSVVFALLIALWTSNDAKSKDLYIPYEYSYFAFIFWPFVLPYHLIKTRGTEGFLMFLGVLVLYFLPFISGLITWAYLLDPS